MTIQSYLVINTSLSPAVCENICVWDGNTETWNPGENYTAMPLESTTALVWEYEKSSKSFVLVERIGGGRVGYTWDGTKLITNATMPTQIPISANTVAEIKNF
jgi:hypothetical protein